MSASNTIRSCLRNRRSSLAWAFGSRKKFIRQVTSLSGQAEAAPVTSEKEAKAQNATKKTGNVMSHSRFFEEEYATRVDGEGFGATYDRNKAVDNIKVDREIHKNQYPAYDKTQGERGEPEGQSESPHQCFFLNPS